MHSRQAKRSLLDHIRYLGEALYPRMAKRLTTTLILPECDLPSVGAHAALLLRLLINRFQILRACFDHLLSLFPLTFFTGLASSSLFSAS